MAYEVIARKWRPQQFDDVVGQAHVTDTLKNAITADRIAHAYLFVGPRGIGKTSVARILAKALNCKDGPTVAPCDTCDSCKEIMDGRSLDVLEIDGASNNSVDQVRELRDTVKFLPARGPFKIYIIDEVHMLTPQAFNALLKTLEEPPSHVKFIFATTEPQKVLATILSRCQRFDLRRIPAALIVERLSTIVKAEKVKADEDALWAVARGAEGGLRDAESALDQLISFKGREISEADMLTVFGLVSRQSLEELAGATLGGDIPSLIRIVGELDAAGKDLQRLVTDLLEYFRNLLVSSCTNYGAAELDVTEAQLEVLREQAAHCSQERLLEIADILVEVDGRLRYALSKRTLLETALIRCARTATVVSIDEILQQINILKSGGATVTSQVSSKPTPTATGTKAVASAPKPAIEAKRPKPAPKPVTEAKRPKPEPGPKPEAGEADEVLALRRDWHEIVDEIGKAAPLAKNALLDACPLSVDEDCVVVGFDPEFPEHRERMDVKRNVTAAQNVLRGILGRDVTIRFCMIPEGSETTIPSDSRLVRDRGKKPADGGKRAASGNVVDRWMEHDAIKKTLQAFDGEIIDVRE